MSEIQRLVFFLLKLLCLMRTIANTERTICLTDLLKFYNAGISCSFHNHFFTRNFDDHKTCLVKCTSKTLTPDLQHGTTYALKKLEIKFSNTFFKFTMMKPCGDHGKTGVEITMVCDERGFYDRRMGDSCTTQSHCNVSNPYSTCNTKTGVCECKEGYFERFNTCFPEHLSIGETCEVNEQCSGNTEVGFCRQAELGQVCSPLPETDDTYSSQHTERRICESCTTQSHCDVSKPYSTYNTKTGVCECKEGYFEMFNTCFQEHLSIGDTCELNEQCLGNREVGFCRQTERGKVCSRLPETDNVHSSQHAGFQTNSMPNSTKHSSADSFETTLTYSSKEMARNNDLPVGMIAGAAAAGFVLGIIFCGIFCVMLSRCKKSTSEKRSVEFAATVDNYGFNVVAISTGKTEQKTVQVSEERSQKHVDRKGQTSPPDDIYNHLNEASGMSDIQPEYDHVPSNDTNGETYHRLDLNITRNANTTPLVDMENHYD